MLPQKEKPSLQFYQHSQDYVAEWSMIPPKAFLYFPSQEERKEGEREKAHRNIFETNEPYDDFQEENIRLVNKRLKEYKIQPHSWFDKANKLRYHQAHRFKVAETCVAIKQASNWRQNNFPIQINYQLDSLLRKGYLYFCGRDRQYRPVIGTNFHKMIQQDIEELQKILMVLMEYMIEQLLIGGQVECFVLLMDLSVFSKEIEDAMYKILEFISSTYRGRLYTCYLLNFQSNQKTVLSNISPQINKRIIFSKKKYCTDMWGHLERPKLQAKYGGFMKNMESNFWPPSKAILSEGYHQDYDNSQQFEHISRKQYDNLYHNGKLANRKVYSGFITRIPNKPQNEQKSSLKIQIPQSSLKEQMNSNVSLQKTEPTSRSLPLLQDYQNIPQKKEKTIKIQIRNFPLLFEAQEFISIAVLK